MPRPQPRLAAAAAAVGLALAMAPLAADGQDDGAADGPVIRMHAGSWSPDAAGSGAGAADSRGQRPARRLASRRDGPPPPPPPPREWAGPVPSGSRPRGRSGGWSIDFDTFVAHYHDPDPQLEPRADPEHEDFDPFHVPMPKLKRAPPLPAAPPRSAARPLTPRRRAQPGSSRAPPSTRWT